MKKLYQLMTSSVAIVSTFMALSIPALALNINFSYEPGISADDKAAAELAALIWEQYLTDDITVNIHLDKGSITTLPLGVLSGSVPAFMNGVDYNRVSTALQNSANSTDDQTARRNLPPTLLGSFSFSIEGGINQSTNNISITRANAKALNLINKNDTQLDGIIVYNDLANTLLSWQPDYLSNGVGQTQFDLTSVLIHEIGHILGFVSGIDAVNNSNYSNISARSKYITPFDLFRKSAVSGLFVNMSYGGTGANAPWFSFNGVWTGSNLSTGANKDLASYFYIYLPDGSQGSHWKFVSNGVPLGIMDPAIPPNTRRTLDNLDLQALDVIGYRRASSTFNSISLSQLSTLKTQAQITANSKLNATPVTMINTMFQQNRWGGTATTTGFGQVQDLTQYLGQQGLFQVNNGTMWIVSEELTKVPKPNGNKINRRGDTGIGRQGEN